MSTTQLSGEQVLQSVYDPATESLKVDVEAVVAPLVISDTTSSIKIGDGTGVYLDINPDGSINTTSAVSGTVNTNLNGLTNFQTSQYTIGTSAVQLTPTPLSGRSSMSIKVTTTGTGNIIYIGNSSGVTTATGYPLFNGDSLQIDLTDAHVIYAISNAASQTAYVLEIGD